MYFVFATLLNKDFVLPFLLLLIHHDSYAQIQGSNSTETMTIPPSLFSASPQDAIDPTSESMYTIPPSQVTRKLKLGFIVTEERQSEIGFSTTGGAVALALETIRKQNILPTIEFEFYYNYTLCDEKTAIGIGVEMITEHKVDVIIGPPCSTAILPVALLGSFYETLQVAWGYATAQTFSDNKRFPFLSVITANSLQLGYGLSEILALYSWSEIGLFYMDDTFDYCGSFMDDIETALGDEQTTTVNILSRVKIVQNSTLEDFMSGLLKLKDRARVVAVCMPDTISRRTFLIAAHANSMVDAEWVYINVDLKGVGIGQTGVSSNTTTGTEGAQTDSFTGVWIDTVGNNSDGMDEVAKLAARRLFALDIMASGNELIGLEHLRYEIFTKVRGYPFYCQTDDCLTNFDKYTGVGAFTSHLYDSFLLYAHIVNKTMAAEPDNWYHNLPLFMNVRESISFQGLSGIVQMTPNGTREPKFFLYGMSEQNKSSILVNVTYLYDGDLMVDVYNATPNYVDEWSTVWMYYGGMRPITPPRCGYNSKSCPEAVWKSSWGFIVGGIALLVLVFLISMLFLLIYYRVKRKEQERLDAEWKIPSHSLEKPKTADTQKSIHSLHSSHTGTTTTTRFSFGAVSDSETYSFCIFLGDPVLVEKHPGAQRFSQEDSAEFRMLRKMDHDNVNRFLGLTIDLPPLKSVWRYCSRGSLEDVIWKRSIHMDGFFMFCLISDIAEGMVFLQKSHLGYHGNLNSMNCLIDDRWQVKITGFGMRSFRMLKEPTRKEQLWFSPERLREEQVGVHLGSQDSDIYAFAIISSEIVTQRRAWGLADDAKPSVIEDILYDVKRTVSTPRRPELEISPDVELNPGLLHVIRDCWSEAPAARPDFRTIRSLLRTMSNGRKRNLMDHVFNIMESYAETLEHEVAARTGELVEEQKKSDLLLYRMLPKQVADRLKLGQTVEPESYDSVTVFFSDVVKFTNLAAKCTPLQIVNVLNDLYSTFDTIIEQHGVYKVETIGDGYLCVSGLPKRNGKEHVKDIAEMSLGFLTEIKSFRIAHLPHENVNIRVGMHSGPCVAGVVGLTMPRYCLFGDTVNTASRMESNGKPGQIHMSSTAHQLLQEIGGYVIESRGEVIIKGKGVMETYWLLGREGEVLQSLEIESREEHVN